MTGFLRFIGILNASVWFGASVFFVLAVGPAVFSGEVQKLFGEAAPFYSGGVALAILKRYFSLQCFCGIIALVHLLAERLYMGKSLTRFSVWLVGILLGLTLIGGVWLQPKMAALRQARYFAPSNQERVVAEKSFKSWHGIAQGANLMVTLGVLLHLWNLTRPTEIARYNVSKFRS